MTLTKQINISKTNKANVFLPQNDLIINRKHMLYFSCALSHSNAHTDTHSHRNTVCCQCCWQF